MKQAPKELLVEGADDVFVFVALFTEYRIPLAERNKIDKNKISIRAGDGIDNVKQRLRILLKPMDEDAILDQIGVVIDADTDIDARWQSIRDILRESGYANVPDAPAQGGTIVDQQGKPRVGVWIMPDNRLTGAMEDFIKFLVPQGDALWPRAEGAVDAIPAADRLFSATAKVYIHTWLAWQQEPGKPMGQAITYKFLDAQAPYAQELMAWVKRLFFIS